MSTYADRDDLEARYGETNIRQMADMDNTNHTPRIDARVETALQWGTEYIDDKMRNGPYKVPLVPDNGTVGARVVDWNVRLAALWLHKSRAMDMATETFAGVEETVIDEMNRVMQGWITIPCERDPNALRGNAGVLRG